MATIVSKMDGFPSSQVARADNYESPLTCSKQQQQPVPSQSSIFCLWNLASNHIRIQWHERGANWMQACKRIEKKDQQPSNPFDKLLACSYRKLAALPVHQEKMLEPRQDDTVTKLRHSLARSLGRKKERWWAPLEMRTDKLAKEVNDWDSYWAVGANYT